MSVLSDKIFKICSTLNDEIREAKKKKLMIEVKIGNTSYFIHPNDKDEAVPQIEVYTWKRQ